MVCKNGLCEMNSDESAEVIVCLKEEIENAKIWIEEQKRINASRMDTIDRLTMRNRELEERVKKLETDLLSYEDDDIDPISSEMGI